MCKKAFVIFLVLLLALCTTVYAGGSSGNCVEPLRKTTEFLGVGAAGEYNYMHDRMNNLNNKYGPKGMKVTEVNQIYGKGIIGLFDNFNIYGKAGGTNYNLRFIDRPQDAEMLIDLKDGIYAGIGFNGHFPLADIQNNLSLGLGFDIQGNFSYNDVEAITRSGDIATNVDGTFYGVDGKNSLYLTCKYTIDNLKTSIIPYVGGYHSWMVVGTAEHLTYDTRTTGPLTEDFQAAFDLLGFGVLVGVDVDIGKYVVLSAEGRFIGETAITTGASIKF